MIVLREDALCCLEWVDLDRILSQPQFSGLELTFNINLAINPINDKERVPKLLQGYLPAFQERGKLVIAFIMGLIRSLVSQRPALLSSLSPEFIIRVASIWYRTASFTTPYLYCLSMRYEPIGRQFEYYVKIYHVNACALVSIEGSQCLEVHKSYPRCSRSPSDLDTRLSMCILRHGYTGTDCRAASGNLVGMSLNLNKCVANFDVKITCALNGDSSGTCGSCSFGGPTLPRMSIVLHNCVANQDGFWHVEGAMCDCGQARGIIGSGVFFCSIFLDFRSHVDQYTTLS
ncbi:hypothetical protein A0H81_10958 [Grifola frondosa]|uniref:Cyanovirin-N domain-containing protein n=1 Tax=Grifola frondosa TaxID=5627 RepID=A0A1C7LWW7_GRIFR|nr:hypothetical protein A0H81_10958 [Grifola frondosa]